MTGALAHGPAMLAAADALLPNEHAITSHSVSFAQARPAELHNQLWHHSLQQAGHWP